MGVGDMFGKAKEALSGQSDKVDAVVDQAADAVKEKTPDQVDSAVDQAAQQAKDAL
jgi:gas vesicle protein